MLPGVITAEGCVVTLAAQLTSPEIVIGRVMFRLKSALTALERLIVTDVATPGVTIEGIETVPALLTEK
ncbi:MAG: hypothetical protein L3J82_09325, partial [Planctomycetes bacterium]|nr:hypothetical protein [Planctomycetota bacterium]